MDQAQSAAKRRLTRRIGRRLFHRLVEQHGCTEKSLQQSVVQFVDNSHNSLTLSTTFFQTNTLFLEHHTDRRRRTRLLWSANANISRFHVDLLFSFPYSDVSVFVCALSRATHSRI